MAGIALAVFVLDAIVAPKPWMPVMIEAQFLKDLYMRASPPLASAGDVAVVNSSGVWWAGLLSLIICLGAESGGLRAQDRLATNLAVLAAPARIHPQDLANGWDADDAKVRYLLEELVTQRLESARLSVELAAVKAEAAEIKEVSRQQAALLTALMAVLARRDRQDITLRSETAELGERLQAAHSELQRKHLENSRLAADRL